MASRFRLNWRRILIGYLLGGSALVVAIAGAFRVFHQLSVPSSSCRLPAQMPSVFGALPVLVVAVASIVISSGVPARRRDWGGVIKDGGILGLIAIVVTLGGLFWLYNYTCGGD